jgi:hypothetical protein
VTVETRQREDHERQSQDKIQNVESPVIVRPHREHSLVWYPNLTLFLILLLLLLCYTDRLCSKSQNEIQNVEPSVIVGPHRELFGVVVSLLFYPFIIVVLHIAVFIGT